MRNRWQAVEYSNDNKYYPVCVLDRKYNLHFWIDVWIDEDYNDVIAEWNQDTFYLDNSEDRRRRNIQDNCDNYMNATSEAINFLVAQDIIYQDDKANWYYKEDNNSESK